MNYNLITIIGRLTKDPERMMINNGSSVVKGSIAYNENHKVSGEWQTESFFFDFESWDEKMFENILSFKTGDEVLISGAIRYRDYTKRDGTQGRTYSIRLSCFRGNHKDKQTPNQNHGYQPNQQNNSSCGYGGFANTNQNYQLGYGTTPQMNFQPPQYYQQNYPQNNYQQQAPQAPAQQQPLPPPTEQQLQAHRQLMEDAKNTPTGQDVPF